MCQILVWAGAHWPARPGAQATSPLFIANHLVLPVVQNGEAGKREDWPSGSQRRQAGSFPSKFQRFHYQVANLYC